MALGLAGLRLVAWSDPAPGGRFDHRLGMPARRQPRAQRGAAERSHQSGRAAERSYRESVDRAILTLVRHGETSANLEGIWHGSTDGPLTERGRAQAGRVAGWLRREFPE